jgi:hypothetical protein
MEKSEFDALLLKTAFACMACDGHIDKSEVDFIIKIHRENKIFGAIDIRQAMENLLVSINNDGHKFLRDYFTELTTNYLSVKEELKIIEAAINTIKADEKIEYSEIKFFKVIRSKLKIDNNTILSLHPDFEEYLEQDILSESYLASLQNDFFESKNLAEFEITSLMVNNKIN